MNIFTDKNKVTLVQSITTASTFVSSITGIIKNRILQSFPKDYFRYIYTDTSEMYQEFNKTDAYNKHLPKIPYPSLTVSPQLSIDNPVGHMKSFLMSSPHLWVPRDINRECPLLLEEPNGKYRIYFTSDYITMNVKFNIIVDSFIQATEVSYYLKSRFNDEMFKYLNSELVQSEIPKSFINAIAKIENLFTGEETYTNMEDQEKLDKLLMEMGRRTTPILRKTSLNNGRVGYYFEDAKNLLTLFTDLDIPEGMIRDNDVSGEYEISFRVQVSGWWPNAYIMVINKQTYQTIEDIIEAGTTEVDNKIYSTTITKISLDRKNTKYFQDTLGEEYVGNNILHETYVYDHVPFSSINISSIIWNNSKVDFKSVHAYMIDNNMDITKLLNIVVRASSGLNEMIGTVDYKTFNVTFTKEIDSDMVVDVFMNRAMYDSVKELMAQNTFYSNDYALATIDFVATDPTTGEKTVQHCRVYKFNNGEEYSTDLNKSVRVKTTYGIGYIGIVPEDNPNASNVKICVGHNKYNVPIIRCLEKIS